MQEHDDANVQDVTMAVPDNAPRVTMTKPMNDRCLEKL